MRDSFGSSCAKFEVCLDRSRLPLSKGLRTFLTSSNHCISMWFLSPSGFAAVSVPVRREIHVEGVCRRKSLFGNVMWFSVRIAVVNIGQYVLVRIAFCRSYNCNFDVRIALMRLYWRLSWFIDFGFWVSRLICGFWGSGVPVINLRERVNCSVAGSLGFRVD